MAEIDRLFAETQDTPDIFAIDKKKRADRAALLATTALSQRSTFDPDKAARRHAMADVFNESAPVKLDPRYISDDNEGALQTELDKRRLRAIAEENDKAANWLTGPGNAEMAYDDLNTVGGWGAAANAAIRGADATIDGADFALQMGTLLEYERLAEEDQRPVLDRLTGARDAPTGEAAGALLGVGYDYVMGRLGALFRYGDNGETLSKVVPAEKNRLLKDFADKNADRAGSYRGTVSFDDVNKRVSELPKATNMWEGTKNIFDIASDDPAAFMSWALQISAESASGIAVAAALTAVTKNPTVGFAGMGAVSAARSQAGAFDEILQDGGYDLTKAEDRQRLIKDPKALRMAMTESGAYGLVVGLLDGMSGGLATTRLVNSAAGNMILQIMAQGVLGGSGEALGRLAGNMEIDWTEVMIEGIVEIATGPLEILSAGSHAAIGKVNRSNDARARREVFKHIAGLTGDSKLSKRSKAKYGDLISTVTRDGPIEDLYVNPDDFTELMQSTGTTPEAFLDALPGSIGEAYAKARDTGTDFTIPTSVYAAHVVGTKFEAALGPYLRFGAMEMTMAESQNMAKDIAENLDSLATNAEKIQTTVDSLSAEATQQYESLVSQLQMAGKTNAVASREALPFAQFLDVRAARSGIPVADIAKKYREPIIRARERAPATISTVPRVSTMGLYKELRSLAGDTALSPNAAAVQRTLQERGVEDVTPEAVRDAILTAAGRGQLTGQLDDALIMEPSDMTTVSGEEMMQTVSLRNGTEDVAKWGLGVPQKTRAMATLMQVRQRKVYGKIGRDSRTPKTINKMAQWMADEIEFELQAPDKSAFGWYSTKFQNALNIMGSMFPELMDQLVLDQRNRPLPGVTTVADVRALVTMILAITSNGAKVIDNFRMAAKIYKQFRVDGSFDEAFKGNLRTSDMRLKLGRMAALAEEFGSYDAARIHLLEEMTAQEMNDQRVAAGEKATSGMPPDMIVPRAAVIFGPKLGAFYANLSGSEGFLTMDMWWNRTINRYRGDILPKLVGLSGSGTETTAGGKPQGLHRFKLLINRPDLTDKQALNYATEYAQRASDKKFKGTTEAEKAGNTLYKAAFVLLREQPDSPADRTFMYRVARAAQVEISKRRGIDMSIADIQAVIWYYEKRLYSDMGVRDSGDISYEEAATRVVAAEAKSNELDGVAFEQNPIPAAALPNLERASPGPVAGVREVATKYMKAAGLPVRHQATYATVDEDRATRIAAEYDKMGDAPNDPEVKAAYEALAAETLAQFEALKELGYTFSFITGADPYATPADAVRDMQDNKHLWVFPTEGGFGTNTEANADHPLLRDSGIKVDGRDTVVNDIFRIVHDVFGHGSEGASFGARGEENAWQAHVRMFSPLAARAMTSETRGQNSWVNYGPQGVNNKNNPKETVFADQKTGLLPEWVSTEGIVTDRELNNDQPVTMYQIGRNAYGKPKVASIADFDEFPLSSFQADGWFIVSPNTELQPERQDEMRAQLDELGLEYRELQGVYMGEPDGVSFLVVGAPWIGRSLGSKYGQESILTQDGLEYTDESGRRKVPFDGVLTGADATAQENHSIRLSDGKAFSLNLLWPEPVAAGMADGRYYGVALTPEGKMKMTHWSDQSLSVIDPAQAGTGPLSGEERNRRQVEGSFYGLNVGERGGYTKESLGPYKHEVLIDPTDLYSYNDDPDNLQAKIPSDTPAAQRAGAYEEQIQAAGFKGYFVNRGPVGMVAKAFVALTPEAPATGETEFYQNGKTPTFKSPLAEAVANAKQTAARASDWLSIIGKMPGVKDVERWFTGVDAYLETIAEEDPKRQVTREELHAWVSANTLEIVTDTSGKEFQDYIEQPEVPDDAYRVVKITVPNLHKVGPNAGYGVEPFTHTGHFRDENIVVHARVAIRGGVFFIEEIQSDLNSDWRKNGTMPASRAEASTLANGRSTAEIDAEGLQVSDAMFEAESAVARVIGSTVMRNIANTAFEKIMTAASKMHEQSQSKVLLNEVVRQMRARLLDAEDVHAMVEEGVRFGTTQMDLNSDELVLNGIVRLSVMDAIMRVARREHLSWTEVFSAMPVELLTELQAVAAPTDEIITLGDELRASSRAMVDTVVRMAEIRLERDDSIKPALLYPITPFAGASAIELATKQLIRMAVEEGHEAIAWTPAYIQGERWGQQVGQVVDSIEAVDWVASNSRGAVTRQVSIRLRDDMVHVGADADGMVVEGSREGLVGQQLADIIGPDMTDMVMMGDANGSISGDGVTWTHTEGEGFITVYDRQIKKFVEKFAKKNGGSVETRGGVVTSKNSGGRSSLAHEAAQSYGMETPYNTRSFDRVVTRNLSDHQREAIDRARGMVAPLAPQNIQYWAEAGEAGRSITTTNVGALTGFLDAHDNVARATAGVVERARAAEEELGSGYITVDGPLRGALWQAQNMIDAMETNWTFAVEDLASSAERSRDTARQSAEAAQALRDADPIENETDAIKRDRGERWALADAERVEAERAELIELIKRLKDPATLTAMQQSAFWFDLMENAATPALMRIKKGGMSDADRAGMQRPVWYSEITPQMREAAMQPWTLFQSKKKGPFGSIILPPPGTDGQAQINLFENANLSTVLHEGGHYFLWVLQSMAKEGDASAAAEIAVLTEWWGRNAEGVAEDAGVGVDIVRQFLRDGTTGDPSLDAKVNVGLHEQFARGFEKYLMEGKAPSNVLRAAFESFAAWLMEVYKSALNLNVNVDDEVRGVFDRMLATDEQLDKARADNNVDDEIATIAKEMGLDPAAYSQLIELTTQARDEAKQLALKGVMEPIFRERRAEIKAERADLTERVTKEVMNKKHNRVLYWLSNETWYGGDAPEGVAADMRMDTDMLREEYPTVDLNKLPRSKRPIFVTGSLIQADDVADVFGYASGADMLEDLLTAPKAKDEIKGRVDAEINAKYGDALTDGSIEQQAVDALHGDKRGQVIVAELRAINRIAGKQGAVTSRQKAAAIAKGIIARLSARDAIRTTTFLGAERRYAERAARALAAGDVEQAFADKRKQLINYALYIESKKAAELVSKVENLTGRLRKRSTRQNLAGEYLEAIDAVMDQYSFRKTSGKADQRTGKLKAYVEMMIQSGRENELAIPNHVLSQVDVVPYKTLPMERLRGVYETLQNIEHAARFKQKLRDAKAARDMDEVVGDIAASFAANVKGKPPASFPSKTSKIIDGAKEYVNLALNADTILRRIDGWSHGAITQHLKRRIDEAEINALQMRQKAAEDFEKLYSVYGKLERPRMAVKQKIDGFREAMSKWDIIAIALNTGNKNNYERLTSKDASRSFTPDEVDTLIDTLDDRDMMFVQSVWDYIGTYWEAIAERERRTTGVVPERVEAEFMLKPRRGVRGGYFPIKYDPNLSSKVAEEADQDIFTNMMGGRFGKAQTKNGHLQERGQGSGGRSLAFGMQILHSHVQSVIHDLAFSEAINSSWKILQDKRVRGMFEKNGMVGDHRSLELWLQDTATGQIMTTGVLGRVARSMKNGFTLSKLAFNMSTVAVQMTGIAQTAALIGKKNMAIGYGKYVGGGMYPVAKKVAARSPFMAERETTFQRDIYDMLNETSSGPLMNPITQFRNVMIQVGFYAMQKVQFYTVDVPTWLGAYEAELAKGSTEEDAAYLADRMVARAQSSGLFSDRSSIERGSLTPNQRQNDFVRLFTALGSYMIAKLNVATEVVGRTDMSSPMSMLNTLVDLVLLFTVEAVLYGLIKGTLPGMGEDDGEDEAGWLQFLATQTALSAMSMFPFIRDMAGAFQGFSGGGAYGGVIETIAKPFVGMADGEMSESDLRAIIDGVGLAVPGIPSTAINRILKAEQAKSEGKDVSPIAYIMGLPR